MIQHQENGISTIKEKIHAVAGLLGLEPEKVYCFGGVPRDMLLNKTPNDYDYLIQTDVDDLVKRLQVLADRGKLESKPPMKPFNKVFDDTYQTRICGCSHDFKAMGGRSPIDIVKLSLLTCETLYVDCNGVMYDHFGGVEDIKNNTVRISRYEPFGIRDLFRYYRYKNLYGDKTADPFVSEIFPELKEALPKHAFHYIKTDMGKITQDTCAADIVSDLNNTGVFENYIPREKLNIERLKKLAEYRDSKNLILSSSIGITAILPKDETVTGLVRITQMLFALQDKTVERRDRNMFQYYFNKQASLIANGIDRGNIEALSDENIDGVTRFYGLLLSDDFYSNTKIYNDCADNMIKKFGETHKSSGKTKMEPKYKAS